MTWLKAILWILAIIAGIIIVKKISERITRESAKKHLEKMLQEKLKEKEYNKVNVGLTAEVTDIQTKSDETDVTFQVNGHGKMHLISSLGTDLKEGQKIKLQLS